MKHSSIKSYRTCVTLAGREYTIGVEILPGVADVPAEIVKVRADDENGNPVHLSPEKRKAEEIMVLEEWRNGE